MSEFLARIKEAVQDKWDGLSIIDKTRVSSGAIGLAVGLVVGAVFL